MHFSYLMYPNESVLYMFPLWSC